MKLKVMIAANQDGPQGLVICLEDGTMLPGLVKVDSYSPGLDEYATVTAEFIVDGKNVLWSDGVPHRRAPDNADPR